MISIPTDFREASAFSQLFEASADEIRKSALVLSDLLTSSPREFDWEAVSQIGKQTEQINAKIAALLCQSFITPFEWQDLEALSIALYQISKTIHKFSIRILLSKSCVPVDFFDLPAKILTDATGVVHEMVRQLWHQPDLSQIKKEIDCLCSLEDKADKLVFEMLRDPYSGEYDVLQAIILHDLARLLEKVIDHCLDVGNVTYQIGLKNS
jgi:uncharacterized protein